MWTPTVAMLWECWRLSRRSLGICIAIATFGGWVLLSIEMPIMTVTVLAGVFAWFGQSWAVVDKRNRFSFALGFTRPVATWKLALVPLTFVAVASVLTYLVPVVILGTAFGVAFPTMPMAALCATMGVAWVSFLWQTSDPVVRRITGIAVSFGLVLMVPVINNVLSSGLAQISSSPLAAYAAMAFTSAVAFAMAVIGVARQRCGSNRITPDGFVSSRSRSRTRSGLMSSLGYRMRVPCPVSSPALAQLWFEFRTVSGRVAKSMALFIVIISLSLVANSSMATGARLVVGLWVGIALPMWLTVRSLFGLQRMQGHTRLDVFAGVRPIGTARLVLLKVLAGSVVLFTAWAALAAGLWIFRRWFAGPEEWAVIVDYFYYFLMGLGFIDGPASSRGVSGAAIRLAALIQATAVIAGAAAFHALFVLHAKRVVLAALAVMLYTVFIATLAMRGWIAGDLMFELHSGALAAAAVIGTLFVLWRGQAERIFSATCVAFIVATGLAYAIVCVSLSGTSIDQRMIGLLIGLMPFSAMALAPWSFSRLRHQ